MITRMQMPRQLRNKGGIMTIGGGGYTGKPMGSRTGFGFIDKITDRFRKLIPNELASVAVKAAPFVAPFNPGIAGLMRGIGRFDQRGSLSDAFKQGLATYGGGQAVRMLGGAGFQKGLGTPGDRFTSPLDTEKTTKFKKLFDRQKTTKDLSKTKDKPGFLRGAAEETIGRIPVLKNLSPKVQEKLLAGTITSGASALYSYFTGEFEPQEPGETVEEYMARRRERVKSQMRQVMDSYYTPLRNPEYAAMSDEEKNNFIDGVIGTGMATGGRVGYQTGGITMANTLAENIRRNLANQAAFQQAITPTRERVKEQIRKRTPVQEYAMGEDSILGPLSKKAASTIIEGQDKSRAALDLLNKTSMTPTETTTSSMMQQPGETFDDFLARGGNPFAKPPGTTDTAQIPETTDTAQIPGEIDFSKINLDSGFTKDDLKQAIKNAKATGQNKEYIDTMLIKRQDSDAINFFKDLTPTPTPASERNMTDPMLTGFDYSQPVNWSPGQPAPEGYRVVNMMGDEFLERIYPSKEEIARLPMPLMGPAGRAMPLGLMMPPSGNYEDNFQDPDAGLSGKEYAEKYGLEYAKGGRVNFEEGGTGFMKWLKANYGLEVKDLDLEQYVKYSREFNNENPDPNETGRKKNAMGSMPVGIMRTNKAGVMERDYRDKGGFVPVGIKEKADDVPAMLSKNEFVFTADAVRGAGNGSIEKGAQKMYNTMKNLEKRVV